MTNVDPHLVGRLMTKPGQPSAPDASLGLLPLALESPRDGFVYVPAGCRGELPAPLAVMLHGAGGRGEQALERLSELANEHGVLLLAPDSRSRTWDVLRGGFGPDVAFIDRALGWVFERFAVDPARLAIGGFSDGASYALTLGLLNGDLFSHVLAFSPGFVAAGRTHGAPRVFISHGIDDQVLPIDTCSRQIVPQMREADYDVTYREFEGGHTVPPEIAAEAFAWLAGDGS